MLFLLDAVTFLVYAFVMYALVPEPDLATSGHGGRTGSYREVLRHRPFVAVIALNALFIFAGFSGFDVLPVYAKNEGGLSETQIGLLFLVNTLVIVFTQLPIARLSREVAGGCRRSRSSDCSGPAPGSSCRSRERPRRPRRRSSSSSWSWWSSPSGSASTEPSPRRWPPISRSPASWAGTWR